MSWTGDLAQKITDNIVAREKQFVLLITTITLYFRK